MRQRTPDRASESTVVGLRPSSAPSPHPHAGRARPPATWGLIALAATTFVLGATACSIPSTHSSPAQPVGLLGVEWILDAASLSTLVAKVPPGLHIDLRFDTENVNGSAGCNTYGGGFEAIGGSISFGPIQSTQIACEKRVMAAEAAYQRALESSTTYHATHSTLHLTGGPVDLTFMAASPASGTASPSQ